MGRNGDLTGEEDGDDWRPLLYGAKNADEALPVIAKAAQAMLRAGSALSDIAESLKKIGDDTARAISDTVELKKHLKAITAREQATRDSAGASVLAMEKRLRAVEKRLAPAPKNPKKKRRRR
jgi:hypothetical protein